jgi:hypothetical protein
VGALTSREKRRRGRVARMGWNPLMNSCFWCRREWPGCRNWGWKCGVTRPAPLEFSSDSGIQLSNCEGKRGVDRQRGSASRTQIFIYFLEGNTVIFFYFLAPKINLTKKLKRNQGMEATLLGFIRFHRIRRVGNKNIIRD